ncbi:hypothetical protein B0H10DRAFT_2385059 [Mycena sp. CBHHK59/15]|nr:hypothetical protein B0H10DRAFT_2385059 [Mycena sp. CBHHK59/15]
MSSTICFELRHRHSLLGGWIRSKKLAATEVTIEQLLQAVDEHDFVSLAMKPYKSHLPNPILSFSIKVDKLDAAAVSAQLFGLSHFKSSGPPASGGDFEQVLRRLETVIHPLSNAVFSLAACIVDIVKDRILLNSAFSTLVLRIHAVLQFIELAESIPDFGRFTSIIEEILRCVGRCILFISNHERDRTDEMTEITRFQDELQELENRMGQALSLGTIEVSFKIESGVEDLSRNLELARLSPLAMSLTIPTCLPGTRSKVLSALTEWGLLSFKDTSNILWVYAHAGSGKSTISATMATVFEQLGFLGSFVFFNRDVKERSGPFGMIRTIAHHLGLRRDNIAQNILNCVKTYPRISEMDLEAQFQRLLVQPLGSVPQNDHPIEQTLRNIDDLRVYDLDQCTDIHDDIRAYIWAKMQEIQQANSSYIPHSNGLFIWAAVACSYIEQSEPTVRIQTLLVNPYVRAKAEKSLDGLYEVTIREWPWLTDVMSERMHDVLAVVMISQNPQSAQTISEILGIDSRVTSRFISRLQSILGTDEHGFIHVVHPSLRDYLVNSERCNPKHPWFIDEQRGHLMMALRCIDRLGNSLRRNMLSIPNLMTPSTSSATVLSDAFTYASVSWVYHVCLVTGAAEIPELVSRIDTFLSKHFLHWIEVLSILGQSRNAIDWIKQMQGWYSLYNNVGSTLIFHPRDTNAREQTTMYNTSLETMLYDGWRFVKAFSKTIESHPLLIYQTAVPFCPKQTAISTQFSDQNIAVVSGCLQSWSPSLMTLSGHRMSVNCLAVSNAGDIVATGSRSGTLNLWNTSLGIQTLPPLQGETWGLASISFSSDSTVLFSGVSRGEICVWDVHTGKILQTLHARNGEDLLTEKKALTWFAVSGNDSAIVCGFQDGSVQILDTKTPDRLCPLLNGHTDAVNAVAFSYSQGMVISASVDSTIRLWDSQTGACITEFWGHTASVEDVAFSPDDSKIVSGSFDGTMKIWDVSTGSLLHDCRHRLAVCVVAFSHDGLRVATGSSDTKIRIWDSQKGEEIQQLCHHRGAVRSLAFAPGDQTIISGSDDTEVRIWSLSNMSPQIFEQPSHSTYIICVALAHNQTLFASGSGDASLIVWNMSDGHATFPPLVQHTAAIMSLEFSDDDTLFASGSKDKTICIWETATGQLHCPPLEHPHEIVCMSFSKDGRTLASITLDNALTLWSVRDKTIKLGPLSSHNRKNVAVAFSPDGMHVATLCIPSDPMIGIAYVVRDTVKGHVLLETTIDTAVDGAELFAFKIQYSAGGRYLIIRYWLAITGIVGIRAFDAVTGEECSSGPNSPAELGHLFAKDNQVFRRGALSAQLPLDLNHQAKITLSCTRYAAVSSPPTRLRLPIERSAQLRAIQSFGRWTMWVSQRARAGKKKCRKSREKGEPNLKSPMRTIHWMAKVSDAKSYNKMYPPATENEESQRDTRTSAEYENSSKTRGRRALEAKPEFRFSEKERHNAPEQSPADAVARRCAVCAVVGGRGGSVRASRRRRGSAPQMRAGKGVDARTQEASPHGLRTRGARAAEGEEGSGMTRAKWVERERASL